MARGKPETGRKAPAFHLESTAGDWSLAAALGAPLVLYFYPRDNTPGCTTEGRAFAANHAKFRAAGATIVGVSPDSIESHRKFRQKFDFPFELLSDPERRVCELYDVIREKSLYGRKFLGVERSTFLIDARGVLRQEWRKVKVDGHAEAVLAAVKAL
ncbi:MAG: peroxiredoxin [Gammaproteobacteria bacterium]|nr:peroxiredoxin [Gammaproteobacteria bacterium]